MEFYTYNFSVIPFLLNFMEFYMDKRLNNSKVSVVIPTLQKQKDVLINLIKTLISDLSVGEIILIDNSGLGLDITDEKLRIILPTTNLYVNPSWNLGVKEAKFDIIGLFNDDLAIPENFCRDVISQMKLNMGIIGFNSEENMICMDNILNNPNNTNPIIEKAQYRSAYFGSIMFFYKNNYKPIPENIKIVYGDDWLADNNKNNLYKISNQIIYHLGSLSSGEKVFNPICKKDAQIYKKLTVKWYQRLFSKQKIWDGVKIRILGITFKFIDKKRRMVRNG